MMQAGLFLFHILIIKADLSPDTGKDSIDKSEKP